MDGRDATCPLSNINYHLYIAIVGHILLLYFNGIMRSHLCLLYHRDTGLDIDCITDFYLSLSIAAGGCVSVVHHYGHMVGRRRVIGRRGCGSLGWPPSPTSSHPWYPTHIVFTPASFSSVPRDANTVAQK